MPIFALLLWCLAVGSSPSPAVADDSYPATEGLRKSPSRGVLKRYEQPSPSVSMIPKPLFSPTAQASPTAEESAEYHSPKKVRRKRKAVPAADAQLASLPALFKEVEAKYSKAATLNAEFTQVNESATLKQTKKSTGTIMVKRPDKLRWETLKPDMNVLVSDGVTFWFYTPPFDEDENGQVIERKSSEVQSRLANALLSGSFSKARDMKIRQETPSRYTLTPKPGSAGTVSLAKIEIDPEAKLIRKVILEHRGGNRSEITLSKIELGKPMDDELFHFTPPPKTDRVDK